LILLLLSVSPTKGDTKLQKQVFLAWKQIFPDTTLDPVYFPHRYGAFSVVVKEIMKGLLEQKLVQSDKRRGEGTIYTITDFGRERIDEKMKRLKIDVSTLQEKKVDWDEWTMFGAIRNTYRKYPAFAEKSVMKSLKW
jgi:uncharacterized protein YwgA